MGMGRTLSEDFLREGCAVALVDVKGPALAEAQAELAQTGKCAAFVCDISDGEAVYALARRVEKEFGPVDIPVNNAGIVQARELLDLSDDDIEKTLRINLTAQFWTCKAFLPSMIQRGSGHIVNFASAGGILASGAAYFPHHFFGPGRWEGKAFNPTGENRGYGYNLFQDAGGKIYRTRRMDTEIGLSDYDGKPAFKLNYGAYNSGTVHSMRDEVRRINDDLFLGLGYMALGGGKINPAPFALVGPAKAWVGVDQP